MVCKYIYILDYISASLLEFMTPCLMARLFLGFAIEESPSPLLGGLLLCKASLRMVKIKKIKETDRPSPDTKSDVPNLTP